jgi:ATP-dependent RNA helicase RhlE
MTFHSFGLHDSLIKSLDSQNFEHPFPIQSLVIPKVLEGKDILGIAPTGSGKTASYVLPILTRIAKSKQIKNRRVSALILVPTRELAMQVEAVFKSFAHTLPDSIKVKAVYGGVAINPQMKAMLGGSVLIATPGRLIELVGVNAVKLDAVQTVVLDEADKLLNLGFQEEMQQIIQTLPVVRQNLLFSATLNEKVEEIQHLLLHNPVILKIEEEENAIERIVQSAYAISEERKGPLLRYLIRSKQMKQVLIFTSSTFKADQVVEKLRKNNIDAQAIHSKKSQEKRTQVMRNFKAGHLKVLVATDLLARGIDIEFLPFVINYELPRSPKDFVHRIGRTGRAEATGEAITFVTPADEHHFKVIQKKMGKWVTLEDTKDLNLHGY